MKILIIDVLLKLWFKTIKLELPKEKLITPTIIGVWHQDLFAATLGFKHLELCCLISKSNEGDILSHVLASPNMEIIRGSSSRGNLNIRNLVRLVQSNPQKSIIHALDGPRGPALKPKQGFEWLAQQTELTPIYLEFSYSRFKRLKTWDRMILPMPFSKIKVNFHSHRKEL